MAYPFARSKKSNVINRQSSDIWRRARTLFSKAFNKRRTVSPDQSKLIFEPLEPRILLSADLSYGTAAASELTLLFDQSANEYKLVDQDSITISSVDANAALDGLTIQGTDSADILALDIDSFGSAALAIDFLGEGEDVLFAANDADFILGQTQLSVGSNVFNLLGIESLNLAGGESDNTFTLADWSGEFSIFGDSGSDSLIVDQLGDKDWFIDGDNAGHS